MRLVYLADWATSFYNTDFRMQSFAGDDNVNLWTNSSSGFIIDMFGGTLKMTFTTILSD